MKVRIFEAYKQTIYETIETSCAVLCVFCASMLLLMWCAIVLAFMNVKFCLWIYICDFHYYFQYLLFCIVFHFYLVVVKQPLFAFLTYFDLSQSRVCLTTWSHVHLFICMWVTGWLVGWLNWVMVVVLVDCWRNARAEGVHAYIFFSFFICIIFSILHSHSSSCVSLLNYFDGFFILFSIQIIFFTVFALSHSLSIHPCIISLVGSFTRCVTMIKFEHIMWAQRQHYHLTYFFL